MIVDDEFLTPEIKTSILVEVIKLACHVPGRTLGVALEKAVRENLGLVEDQVGAEIQMAIFLLGHLGVLQVSTHKIVEGGVSEVRFSGDMDLSPSRDILNYIYSED